MPEKYNVKLSTIRKINELNEQKRKEIVKEQEKAALLATSNIYNKIANKTDKKAEEKKPKLSKIME